MKTPIVAEAITKNFKQINALDSFSFDVNRGELFGLIGPDGAGKTTLFRILCSLMKPDSGRAEVLGLDVLKDYAQIRKTVGYMPGKFSLYQDLSVQENLQFFAIVFGSTIQKNYHLIKDIYSQLEPFSHRRAGKLSGGMKQKLALCCALIHAPEVLLLDEPTTGVDPVSRKEFWEILSRLKSNGITILVSTPYMDEASLCSRVALIQNGKLLLMDTPKNISGKFPHQVFSINAGDKYRLLVDLKEYEFSNSIFPFGESIHYTDKRNISSAEISDELNSFLKHKQHNHFTVDTVEATIEDVFMNLTGKS